MSYARKADLNQAQIVRELRQAGYDVDIVHRQLGLYDLVVCGYRRDCPVPVCVRVEVKRPGEQLTPTERQFHARAIHPGSLIIATCADDVLLWFGWEIISKSNR